MSGFDWFTIVIAGLGFFGYGITLWGDWHIYTNTINLTKAQKTANLLDFLSIIITILALGVTSLAVTYHYKNGELIAIIVATLRLCHDYKQSRKYAQEDDTTDPSWEGFMYFVTQAYCIIAVIGLISHSVMAIISHRT